MKRFLLPLLTLCSLSSYSQNIGDKTFDKFDSTYSISTKDETLVGSKFGKNYLKVKIFYSWFKKARFVNHPEAKTYSVLIGFKTNTVTSTSNETEINVQFGDGTVVTYNRPDANYKVVSEMGYFIFDVPLGDKLFTNDIKAIRVRTSEINLDYEIPTKKASYIKNALALVKNESDKP